MTSKDIITKSCNCCKLTKPLDEFHKNSKRKDGYCTICKTCLNDKSKKWKEDNQDKIKKYNKKKYSLNRESELIRGKRYKIQNKEKLKKSKRIWNINNKERINEKRRKRRKIDSLYKLTSTIRSLTGYAYKRIKIKKNFKTIELLGADWEILKIHIEKQFKEGMSWENHGKWHIDHKIPLSSATSELDLIDLCYYTNLQPLWAEENFKKSNKILINEI